MKVRVAAGVVLVGILIAGGYLSRAVLDSSAGGGWSHQAGEAWDAERGMVRTLELGVPNLVLLVDPVFAELDDPAVIDAVAAMNEELAAYTGITQVESYWSLGGPDSYATGDRAQGMVTARIGGSESGLAQRAETVLSNINYDDAVIEVAVGGSAVVQRDARQAVLGSVTPLAIAFLLSIGLVLLFLRRLAATGLIALTSAVAVALTFIALWVFERFITLTTPAVLLALAVAWGTATAGGFVFGHRFVAERHAGAGRTAAVVATVGSAGRTVAIATAVTAAVLLSQWVMPTAMIRSTAYATTVAVLAAGVASVLVLGLLLSLFGAGMATGNGMRRPVVRPGLSDRIAALASARPVATVVAALVVLGGVSLVGLIGLNTGETTAESLPASSPSRAVAQVLAEDFAANEVDAPFVIGPNIDFEGASAQLATYTADLSSIEAVARADSAQGSFAGGAEVTTPDALTARLVNDRANVVRVPMSVPAGSTEARSAIKQIGEVAAPFRADLGGTTARHVATAAAMDARAPFLVISAAVAILLLASWLLRGWQMALRLTVAALLSAAGAVLVVRLGFVGGLLTALFGSSRVETLDAFAAPVAWTVGLALVSGWLVLAWGSAREAFDVTEGAPGAPMRSLAATRWTHLGAAALLWLPFLALAFNGWRTQQMMAVAVVGTGALAVTVGRFVVTPALFAVASGRLWPRRVDGSFDPIYPQTAAAAWLVGAVEQVIPPGAPADLEVVGGTTATLEAIGSDSDLEEWARSGDAESVPSEPQATQAADPEAADSDAAALDALTVDAGADGAVVDATPSVAEGAIVAEVVDADADPVATEDAAVAADASVRRRRRARWRRQPAAVEIPDVVEPVVEVEAGDDGQESVEGAVALAPAARSEPVVVVEAGEEAADDSPVTPDAVADEPSPEPEPVVEVAPDEPAPVVEVAPDEPAPVVEVAADEPAPVVEVAADEPAPEPVVDTEVPAAEPEPAQASAQPIVGDTGEPTEAAGPEATAEPAEVDVDTDVPAEVTGPVAAVDVISLTESVIASLDADTPFTTEISSGFVANPSNNLSRVMEAILRDASGRGGEEVLVYGHAAAGRYRWMVVDSGPRADHDPERARTLAEAQRFIRRVGGVVECRPEGDFTVFVVEIPMAS